MYTAEITNATKTYGPENGTSKIGLMYASDYGFAADPSAWTSNMNSYSSTSITSVNWMYMGLFEWTISRSVDYASSVFGVYSAGNVHDDDAAHAFGVRPVLYLKASVAYSGGVGTQSDSIIIGD